MRTTRPRRPLLALAALPILLWLGAGSASAHAILESVDPADGSTLASAPAVVRLVFSEPVDPSLATISLLDAAGDVIPGVAINADSTDAAALDLALPALAPNAYRVAWRVVDEQDFHVTTGTVVFGLGTPAPAPLGEQVAGASLAEVALRWLVLVLLAAACGGLLLLATAAGLPRHLETRVAALRRRLLRVATAATAGVLVANGGLLLLQLRGAGGTGIDPAALLGTTFGVAWAVEQGVLVALLLAVLRAGRRPAGAPGVRLSVAGGLLLGLAGVQALTGHVATGPAQETPIRWIALTAHLGSVFAWVGGLAALAIAVGPLLRGPRADIGLARAVLGRFWRVAAPALAVLAVTGLYLGGQLVASVDALLLTAYGQALLVKTGVALLAVSLGALNTLALHPALAARVRRLAPPLMRLVPARARLRTVVTLEAGAALAVVAAAAFMSASPPARGPRFEQAIASVAQAPVAAPADDLMVTLAIRPDRPGPNFADIGVLDTRRPAPAPIGRVTIRLVSPAGTAGAALEARATAPGRYEIDNLPIDQAGSWRLAVAIDRAGQPPAAVEFPWSVAPPLVASRPVVISDTPLAPLATPTAVVLALLLAATGVVVIARRRGARRELLSAVLAPSTASPAGSES